MTSSSPEWRLRILLPPNLAAAASRDAIVTRIQVLPPSRGATWVAPESVRFGSGDGFLPGLQAASKFLKEIGGGKLHSLLQLRRAQLRELLARLRGQPAVVFANQPETPLPWEGDSLTAVHPHLVDPPPAPAPPAPSAQLNTRTSPDNRPGPGVVVDGSPHFLAVQLPPRDSSRYAPALQFLKAHGFTLETSNQRWWLRGDSKVLALLAEHLSDLRGALGATFTANFERNLGSVREATLAVEVEPSEDGFVVETRLEAPGVDPAEIARAMALGQRYVRTQDSLVLLPAATLERLNRARAALGTDTAQLPRLRQRVRPPELVVAEEVLEELHPDFHPPETWAARSAALRNLSALPPPPLDPLLESALRPYQKIGVAWLLHLFRNDLGGILADDMGLGKTLQTLAFLAAVRKEFPGASPCLVVAPAGLLENWRREAARWTPGLICTVHHGADRDRRDPAADCDLLLTSYGTLVRDQDALLGRDYLCLVGDEAQHVKNRRTQNARALAAVRARSRFLLTGTPIENSIEDLRSLFHVVLPGYLGAPAGGDDAQPAIARRVARYILRRTKRSVAPELPPRIEQNLAVELPGEHRDAYEALRRSLEAEVNRLDAAGAGEAAVRLAVFTQLLRLRQFCCDPRLLPGKPPPGTPPKLEAFLDLLDESLDGGHRLLVFSQFTSLLDLLAPELDARGVSYLRIDGSTPARQRAAYAETFNHSETIPVMLVSLKAGGTGLNLTGADTVVHYDPWWNPAVEAQATDRAHRIGQTRTVTSIRLFAAGTVEERVLDLQRDKAALLTEVLDEAAAASSSAGIALADLRSLLASETASPSP